MERTLVNGLHLWQFKNLAGARGIRHFVTDRNTKAQGAEFTLSYSSSPDKALIELNRSLLAEAMNLSPAQLFFPHQVHKTRIVNVTATTPQEALQDTDALITREKNVCIAVMSADCVPVLLYDRENKAVAAIHSGWRGTVARILERTLQEMKNLFNSKGDNILVGIGPSVSQESYEVGEEVKREVELSFGKENNLMVAQPGNKVKLDLWQANKIQLAEFGVPPSNIEVSDLCTVKNNAYFFSARKGDAGRFAAGIMLA